jgi:hypothetical protein
MSKSVAATLIPSTPATMANACQKIASVTARPNALMALMRVTKNAASES